MNKVFIMSDYFSLQVLSYEIQYVFDFDINEIIVLEENHRNNPFIWENYPIKITVLKTIEECVKRSNVILVLKNNSIPNNTINYIYETSQKNNKRFYCVDSPDYRMDAILPEEVAERSTNVDIDGVFFDKINILLINVGSLSLSLPAEILLRKIMLDYGVSINQLFLHDSEWIFNQYQKLGILNRDNFHDLKYDISKLTNATIISLDIGYKLETIVQYSSCIKKICPDYIVVVADGNYAICSSKIRNYVKYSCEKNIDFMLFSPFCIVDKKHMINCTENYSLGENEHFFNDLKASTILRNNLLKKLSFPEGIVLCN